MTVATTLEKAANLAKVTKERLYTLKSQRHDLIIKYADILGVLQSDINNVDLDNVETLNFDNMIENMIIIKHLVAAIQSRKQTIYELELQLKDVKTRIQNILEQDYDISIESLQR